MGIPCRLAGGGITARSPAGGVCAATGPRRVEGLLGILPLSLPYRAAAEDKARSAATNRPGRPAQRGRTGRGKAHGRAAERRRPQTHTREPGRKAPLARDASPAGVACWPPRARGARRAPRARSEAEHKLTGRARRARTRGATQTDGGAKRSARGGRATGAEAHNYADPTSRCSGGRPIGGRSTARAQEPKARARGQRAATHRAAGQGARAAPARQRTGRAAIGHQESSHVQPGAESGRSQLAGRRWHGCAACRRATRSDCDGPNGAGRRWRSDTIPCPSGVPSDRF